MNEKVKIANDGSCSDYANNEMYSAAGINSDNSDAVSGVKEGKSVTPIAEGAETPASCEGVRLPDVPRSPPHPRSQNIFSFDGTQVVGGETARGRQLSGRWPNAAPMALDELVECAVCGQRMREPRMLPCQHTFCAECLVEGLHTVKGRPSAKLPCAVCSLELQLPLARAPSTAEEALVSGKSAVLALPRNLYLESLLRLLVDAPLSPSAESSTQPPPYEAHEPCARCRTVGVAVSRCQHCREALCDVCWPAHLAELEAQLRALGTELDAAAERLHLRTRDYEERCEAAGARAVAAAEARRVALQRDEERVQAEVAALRERARFDADALREELRTARDALVFCADDETAGAAATKPAFDPLADNAHKVAEFLRAHGSTAALLARVARWGDARPSFDADAFRVELLAPHASSSTPGGSGGGAGQDDDGPPPETPDAEDVALYYRVRSWTPRVCVRRSALRRPSGATLAPWATATELLVAAADAHVVLVLQWGSTGGRLLRRLSAPEMQCPNGVACSHARQEIYVTDKFNHCVHVFERGGAFVRTMGRKGAGAGMLRSPEGLAAATGAHGEELLYVCDTGNDRVQVLRADTGEPVGFLGSGVVQLNQPTSVAICPSLDLVAIADCGNNRVKVLSLSKGAKVRELGNRGSRRGQFRAPEAVALDPQGFLIVADTGNARLQVFRVGDDWRLVRVLGAGSLQWPSGVHVTPSRDLVVSDARAHAVYVL